MATIEKALQIAAQAHEGQKDKEGQPYILHPLRVMSRVEGEEAQIVAILHDVVEDTTVTLDDLRRRIQRGGAGGRSLRDAPQGRALCGLRRRLQEQPHRSAGEVGRPGR